MQTLYSSDEVRRCLRTLFENPIESQRRTVLVAYVGRDWRIFLPNPSGVEVICSPTPGATSAIAISELRDAGAVVYFSDALHMKIYWSDGRSCLITSANLSMNGLGASGLKEAGVLVDEKIVDINRLVAESNRYAVTEEALLKLKRDGERVRSALARIGTPVLDKHSSYADWFGSNALTRDNWLLGWWGEQDGEESEAAKDLVTSRYGVTGSCENINFRLGQVGPDCWVISFRLSGDKASNISWFFVHDVVDVDPADAAYEAAFPCQAIQAVPLAKCPSPPFDLTPEFKSAFEKTVRNYGGSEIEGNISLVPPPTMLTDINSILASQNIRRL